MGNTTSLPITSTSTSTSTTPPLHTAKKSPSKFSRAKHQFHINRRIVSLLRERDALISESFIISANYQKYAESYLDSPEMEEEVEWMQKKGVSREMLAQRLCGRVFSGMMLKMKQRVREIEREIGELRRERSGSGRGWLGWF